MSRFAYTGVQQTGLSLSPCCDAVEKAMRLAGCKSVERVEQASACVAFTGTTGNSLGLRLLGALLAPASWIPVRLTVKVEENSGTGELVIRTVAEENFGFGSLIGVEKKFRAHCELLEKQLAEAIRLNLERAARTARST
ncbi:hypothetical protein LAZ40_11065 [Cereibacter sphaeroides]|uniref:hypothetical protein n=1 Tax=Cereibacter sphaeroides TaxID=1063 RepID=UPI001F43D493|nr:hypothetical protein [Cereibacter sphaeroides]MCE6959596.1 hypothetical protein [Cereibacter sphaeroides]MCE6974544.1 hypothetical protein [Cereibacter sphaeroides]